MLQTSAYTPTSEKTTLVSKLGHVIYQDLTTSVLHGTVRHLLGLLHQHDSTLLEGIPSPYVKQQVHEIGGIIHTIGLLVDTSERVKVVFGHEELVAAAHLCREKRLWDCQIFVKVIHVDCLDTFQSLAIIRATQPDPNQSDNLTCPPSKASGITLEMEYQLLETGDTNVSLVDSNHSTNDDTIGVTAATLVGQYGGTPSQNHSLPEDTTLYPVTEALEHSLTTLTTLFPKAIQNTTGKTRCYVPRLHTNTLRERLVLALGAQNITHLSADHLVVAILRENLEYSNKTLQELFHRGCKRYHQTRLQKDGKVLQTIGKNGSWYLSAIYQEKDVDSDVRIFDDSWIYTVLKSLPEAAVTTTA